VVANSFILQPNITKIDQPLKCFAKTIASLFSTFISIMVESIKLLTYAVDKKYTEICIPILLDFCEDQNVGLNQSIADSNISEQINGASHSQKLCICN
jgi:hypothetical protein